MEFDLALHPFAIVKRIKLFWVEFLSDFELRHPETRRRLSIELSLKLPMEDKTRFENLINRFQPARRVISFFDWPLLLEWNERRLQAEMLIDINKSFELGQTGSSSVVDAMLSRLTEIRESVRNTQISESPSFWLLLGVRVKFCALRYEAEHLMVRINALSRYESIGAIASK